MKKALSELLGTFLLVFLGTGSIICSEEFTFLGANAPAPIIGGIVTLLIILFGNISGAHLNPAVTVGFYFSGSFNKKEILPYILSQFAGAILASFLLHLLFPTNINLGNTIPTAHAVPSVLFEIFLTFCLMFIILILAHGYKESGYMIAVIVGITIWLEIKYFGPICGASMNPARSFGPALLSHNLQFMWIYLTGPTVGALGAATLFNKIKQVKNVS